MPRRSALVSGIQQLLAGEGVDPRPAQGLFLVPVALEFLLHALTGEPVDQALLAGLAVAVVPSVAAVAIGTGRVAERWTIWLPVLDLVSLCVMRMAPGTAIGAAVAFPAVWLGLQFGWRGVRVVALTALLFLVVPTLWTMGVTVAAVSRVSQMTLMVLVASVVTAGAAEILRDLVERRGADAARLHEALRDLTEQRRLTDSIVTSVDVGLLAIDASGRYDSMNPRHHDFMALAFPDGHEGMAGQLGYVYGPDGTTLLTTEEMPTTRAARGERLRDYLIWVGRDPAERRALAVSATPYAGAEGELAGAVLAYHDITELVLASRIKEEFVASVSHELRTPLTSIMGYVDIVLDDAGELPEDVRHFLGAARRNARRLHRLVDDLLSSALHSVPSSLEVADVPVAQVLRLSALEAATSATAVGVAFELEDPAPEVDLVVHGDAERLAQVFDNLFSNAVKYTPAGGRVTGSLRHEGHEAVVAVSDTGRGIAAEDLDDVFTKFFRSRAVVSDAIPGVGLGLAITKSIVDAHGGAIAVRSVPGEGSTFEVRLPLAVPHPAPVQVSGAA